MDCPLCLETLKVGSTSCPQCGWKASPPVGDQDAPPPAPLLAPAATGIERHWRDQFERRVRVVSEEMVRRMEAAVATAGRQMRQASPFFADLCGYSAMSRQYHPEVMEGLLEKFSAIATEEALAHNGLVLGFTGDGVFMVFGAPISYGADTENAVAAAIAFIRRIGELKRPDGKQLSARVGIATGPVLSTVKQEGFRQTYGLVGDTVNLAARMEQNSTPGNILLCQATADIVRHRFSMEPTQPLKLKNMSDAYVAWRVTGEKQVADEQRPRMPFAGRERELARLTSFLARSDGRDRLSWGLIRGEAGIGKSRIVEQAAERLAQTHAFLWLRNSSEGRHVLLNPVLGLLREATGIGKSATPEELAARTRQFIHSSPRLDPDDAILLDYLLGAGEASARLESGDFDALRERVFRFLRDAIDTVRGPKSGVLVVDDFQWADEMTRKWLEWLPGNGAGRFDILVLARPEEDLGLDDLGRPGLSMLLTGLDDAAQDRLAAHLLDLPGLTDEARRVLRARAGGNPLYQAELARAAAEALQSQPGGLSQERLLELMPASLQSVVQWRIDHLAERARLVLQAGAVLGIEFSSKLLELIEQVRQGLFEHLSTLRARQFIEDAHVPSEARLRFEHPVTREVAYGMLLPEQKRALHREAARRLEESFPRPSPEICDALGYHWLAAEDFRRALHWQVKSADRRQSLGLLRESAAMAETALRTVRERLDNTTGIELLVIRLHLIAGMSLAMLGTYAESDPHLAAAAETAAAIGNAVLSAEARIWQGVLSYRRGESARAAAILAEFLTNADGAALGWVLGPAISTMGLIHLEAGRHEEAIRQFDALDELATRHDAVNWRADALNNTGLALWKLGRFEEALAKFQAAIPLFRSVRALPQLAGALLHEGIVSERLGRFGQAIESFRNATAIAEKADYPVCIAVAGINLSNLLRNEGRFEAAATEAQAAIDRARALGEVQFEGYARNNLSRALVGLSRGAEALAEAQLAMSCARRSASRELRVAARLSCIEARMPRRGSQRRLSQLAAAVVRRLEADPLDPEMEIRALLVHARTLRGVDAEGAAGRVARAAEQAHRLKSPLLAAEVAKAERDFASPAR